MEIRSLGGHEGPILQSLLSQQGIRWFVRNAANCMDNAPVGNAVMLMIALGAGQESGLFRAVTHYMTLSPKERTSLIISSITFLIIAMMIVLGLFMGGNLLLGVSGSVKGGPLVSGLFFILMIVVLLPSLIYGISTDTFHNADECIGALSSFIKKTASFFLTLLVASQLIETTKFTHVDVLLGIKPGLMSVLELLLYWVPLPLIFIFEQKRRKEI